MRSALSRLGVFLAVSWIPTVPRGVIPVEVMSLKADDGGGPLLSATPVGSNPELPNRANASPTQATTLAWEKPLSGWLYVLDARRQVLLVDPESAGVKGRIAVGHTPQMALSPDGTRLYIASSQELSVVDTSDGQPRESVELQHRWKYTTSPYPPSMVVSPDGRWLYVYKMYPGQGAGNDSYAVATFDNTTGRFLPQELQLSGCGASLLAPSLTGLQISCMPANQIHFVQIGPTGTVVPTIEAGLPERVAPVATLLELPNFGGVIWNVRDSLVSPDGHALITIMGDGRVLEVDINARKLSRMLVSDRLLERWVPSQRSVCSPDGTKLYVAMGRQARRSTGMAEEILVIDTSTGHHLAKITTSIPFLSLAISSDGRHIYAPTWKEQSLLVINTFTYQETRILKIIGTLPVRVIVAP